MPRSRRNTFWRSLRYRLGVAVSLLAYLTAAVGLPLPAAPPRKLSSVPFPCQAHACGCRSAEQCWRGCCCFTPEERWKWAKEHHVRPPAYAEKPTARGWNSTRLRDRDAAPRPCCQERPARPASAARERAACCNKPGSGCPACARKATAGRPADAPRPAPASGFRWVLGISSQHCQGLSTVWVSAGSVTPPPPAVTWTPYPSPAGRIAPADASAFHLPPPLPDPPPRAILV